MEEGGGQISDHRPTPSPTGLPPAHTTKRGDDGNPGGHFAAWATKSSCMTFFLMSFSSILRCNDGHVLRPVAEGVGTGFSGVSATKERERKESERGDRIGLSPSLLQARCASELFLKPACCRASRQWVLAARV